MCRVALMLFVLQLNIPVSDSGSFLFKPLGYLQPSFHHPLLFLPTSPWMVQSEREREGMQEQKREGEKGGGKGSHALSYFLNDGDQSRGVGRSWEGLIEVHKAGSQLS